MYYIIQIDEYFWHTKYNEAYPYIRIEDVNEPVKVIDASDYICEKYFGDVDTNEDFFKAAENLPLDVFMRPLTMFYDENLLYLKDNYFITNKKEIKRGRMIYLPEERTYKLRLEKSRKLYELKNIDNYVCTSNEEWITLNKLLLNLLGTIYDTLTLTTKLKTGLLEEQIFKTQLEYVEEDKQEYIDTLLQLLKPFLTQKQHSN